MNFTQDSDTESVAPSIEEENQDESQSDSDDSEIGINRATARTRAGRISRYPASWHDDLFVADPATAIIDENEKCATAYAMSASSDPDTMYLHKPMAADDAKEFLLAMKDEVGAHFHNKNWIIMNKTEVPKNR